LEDTSEEESAVEEAEEESDWNPSTDNEDTPTVWNEWFDSIKEETRLASEKAVAKAVINHLKRKYVTTEEEVWEL
jgi:hypothetical protein